MFTQIRLLQTTACKQFRQEFSKAYGRVFTGWVTSLKPGDQASKSRSRLIQLRANIVSYEAAKQNLIDILKAHVIGQTSGVAVSQRLQLSMIPDITAQIDHISHQLNFIADQEDAFAAEKPFKDLVITLDVKRLATLCELNNAANSPSLDIAKMQTILQQLTTEMVAISAADDALGNYIKGLNN